MVRLSAIAGLVGLLLVLGCTNNPYPDADHGKKVLYSSFNEAPKTLDPAVAYTTAEHVVTGNVYDTLLEYHYLKRPYELIPGLAEAVPKPETQAGRPPGLSLQAAPGRAVPRRSLLRAEPAGPRHARGRGGRRRLSAGAPRRSGRQQPGREHVRRRAGLHRVRQAARRAAQGRSGVRRAAGARAVQGAPAASRASSCAASWTSTSCWPGPIRRSSTGSRCRSPRRCRGRRWPTTTARTGAPISAITPSAPGRSGSRSTRGSTASCSSAIRTGTARCSPRPRRPAPSFPTEIDREDIDAGPHRPGVRRPAACRSSTASASRANAKSIPRFNKFLQGYYDDGGIIKESFDAVIKDDRLSPRDGGARHAPRQGGGADDLLHRLQHGRPGASGTPAGESGAQAAPGHEPGHRRRGATCGCSSTAAACRRSRRCRRGIFGYDERLQEPVPPARPGARARSCWPRPATRTASIPRPDSRCKLTFDTGNTTAAGAAAVRVLRRGLARARSRRARSWPPPTTSSRTRCAGAPTRSSSGAGSPTSPTRRISCSCSSAATRSSKSSGPEHRQLLQRRVRPALPRDEEPAQRRAAGRR